ncbi:MAG: IS30 family transposase [Candidatus Moraniibacteriota bacterium]
MKTYNHFTFSDVIKLETLLQEGNEVVDIALKIGKHKTSIYRCIKNYRDDDGVFRAEHAWEKMGEKKTKATVHYRILPDSILEKYILEKMELHWSPEQIAGWWRSNKKEALCHETIYNYIYEHHTPLIKLYFRRKGKKYQHHRKEKYQILDRRMIDERPMEIETRKEVGHWEGDTIIGKNHQQGIVTNVERKYGYLVASKVEQKTAENILDATVEDFKNIPIEMRLSMTYDNGKEFAWHKLIEYTTKMTIYFAHAYSPWERGTNENTNGLLREFIPKGTDFTTVSEEDLQRYVTLINDRPRKRLGYKSPAEVFALELQKVALDIRI